MNFLQRYTALKFVIDAIMRHRTLYGQYPRCIQLSPEARDAVRADPSIHGYLSIDPLCRERICSVPIEEIPGIAPRLVRFDGVAEDM
jgi:hypothetical protein